MSKARGYIGLLLFLIIALVSAYIGFSVLNAPTTVKYTIQYTQLPADDATLTQWLSNLPGIKKVEVNRQGTSLSVGFQMPHNSEMPDFLGECDRLGYLGRRGYQGSRHEYTWP